MMKKPYFAILILSFFAITSCEEILLEEDISASNVQLLAPSDNSVVKASTITFRWMPVKGASSFHFQIATPNFDRPQQILVDAEIEQNFHTTDLPKNTYEWRVRAMNSGYMGPYSTAGLKVEGSEDFSSRKVALLSPKEEFITNDTDIQLKWNSLEGATLYRVQIMKNGSVLSEATTKKPSVVIEFPAGRSIWAVRAENETQSTFYSKRNILIDTLAPNAPELISPPNNGTLSTTQVNFEWERAAMEGSVEIDSLFIFSDVSLEELVEKVKVTTSYNTILNRNETYYWFMQTYDEAGNESSKSEVFTFTIN